MKILFLSSSIAPLQDGSTGGVKYSIFSSFLAVSRLGHEVSLLAPLGTVMQDGPILIPIKGAMQAKIRADDDTSAYSIVPNSFLENAFYYIRSHQDRYDLVINFSHDWLPYYMTSFLSIPLMHISSMANLNQTVTRYDR